MTQTVPATAVLGPGKTGLTIGLRVLNLDGTEYSAFSATDVTETSTAGTYRKAGGAVVPDAGGYIVWGVSGTDYAEATVDSTAVNVTSLEGGTTPLDNLVLALGTGGLVEKLNSMLEAAGLVYRFTAEALAEAPSGGSGSGTGTYTDTIKDPSNNPLDGARVQLSTDAAGAHRVYEAFTNALGVFVMNPDPGTYYRWIDLAGYTDRLTQGAQVTVT
jgi:hypothetical protein